MKKVADRKFFSMVFLLLFTTVKGLSYHPLAHFAEEDQTKCELCDVVVLNETTLFTFLEQDFQLPTSIVIFEHRVVSLVEEQYPDATMQDFYSRPPPSMY